MNIYTFLTLLPFLFFVYLLLGKKYSLLLCTLITLLLFLFSSLFIWQINFLAIISSFQSGLKTGLDILLIIVGALFFLDFLRFHHIIDHLIKYLESVSSDYRVQTIILAWFLENFIEGIAGFGTPSTIVAPILVSLGLNPVTAVVLSLLGNSVSVIFGAAGTPIRTGFASIPHEGVALFSAGISWVGLLIPVFLLWVVVTARKRPIKDFINALPFAIWAGFVYIISTYIVAIFSQELASILGSVISFSIIFFSLKIKLFTPHPSVSFASEMDNFRPATLFKTFSPYIVFILLLVAGKLYLGSIFNPGLIFISTTIIFSLLWPTHLVQLKSIFFKAIKTSVNPFLVILFMSTIVAVLTNSGQNSSGLISMSDTLVSSIKSFGIVFLSPLIGMFGSFITGSATVSNIMFGHLLYKSSQQLGVSTILVLSLQLVGSAIGNMIALSDMLTAEAVVGLKNQESTIIAKIFPYCIFLILFLSLVGIILRS